MRIHFSLAMGFMTLAGLAGCAQADRASYESCVVNADCFSTSDRCLEIVNGSARDAICSTPCSFSGDFCPRDRMGAAGDCRNIGTGGFNCYQACAFSSDCNFGFACVAPADGGAPICLPSSGGGPIVVPAYESCNAATCDSTTQGCFGITDPGAGMINICTSSCNSDNDCPFDQRGGRGACLDLTGGSNGVCIERCRDDFDCNSDAICDRQTNSGFDLGVFVCLPG